METLKAFATYTFAFAVMAIAYHGLVLYQFELPELVQGALIAWAGSAIAFVFAQETAKASAAASQKAYTTGLATTPTTTTVTSEGPPATSTTTTVGTTPEEVV